MDDVNVRTSTRCPYCRSDTSIERELDPELGAVSLDELETLVRNEWRRRLGPSSYEREHSRTIIRALIVYALAPGSPVREIVARQLIWWELVTLGAWGLSRAAIQREFGELRRAVGDVLTRAGLDRAKVQRLTESIDSQLGKTLQWGEPAPDEAEA
jgi:hypothetical protein